MLTIIFCMYREDHVKAMTLYVHRFKTPKTSSVDSDGISSCSHVTNHAVDQLQLADAALIFTCNSLNR